MVDDRRDGGDETDEVQADTSSHVGELWWDESSLIYEQRGRLPRRDLYRACQLLDASRESEVWDLMTPFEDLEEVRRG